MTFILLTHDREWEKPSNTGCLVAEVLAEDTERCRWARKDPDPGLLDRLNTYPAVLVYPSASAAMFNPADSATDTQFVLIDATWQQSRKIVNRSPYLQSLSQVSVQPVRAPVYNLRRNQITGGLCTAECVMALLDALGRHHEADELADKLQALINLNP